MIDFISELIMSGWVGERLRQMLEDGYFESQEEFSYFVENVFAPTFCFFFVHLIIFTFCYICIVRFVLLLIDLLGDVIRRIYPRLRYGRVIHLYPPRKEVKK